VAEGRTEKTMGQLYHSQQKRLILEGIRILL
jgi:hypothetical protein